ncbi:MAG: cytochrome c3 family protein [Veillonellales bacterium]
MHQQSNQARSILGNLSRKKILIILLVLLLIAIASAMAAQKMSDKPEFCANCHNMQSYYDSWKNSTYLANAHAKAGVNCHDCHTPSFDQQAEEGFKQITGDYEDPMKKREFPKEMCLKCHNMTDVIAKTNFEADHSNPHDSHQGEQECNKCHSMHRESKVMCSQCHGFSWMRNLPPSFKKGAY